MDARPDIVIIGAGMVGATLACALANGSRQIWLIERGDSPGWAEQAPPDLRVSAISLANQRYLEALGIVPRIPVSRLTHYTRLSTWEWLQTPWGTALPPQQATRFSAGELNVPHLGMIVENRALQRAALEQAATLPGVRVMLKTRTDMRWDQGALSLMVGEQWVTPALVIGADGAQSRVRETAGIGLSMHPYEQSAMLINVTVRTPLPPETWQAFTPSGPRALLPLGSPDGQHWASLVWYDAPDVIQAAVKLPPDKLAQAIRAHFPPELPPVDQVHAAGAFPLVRRHALHYVRGNVALAGDAAHTIHPLAGQGVNLGFQDTRMLADELASWAPGTPVPAAALQRYSRQRHRANALMMHGMDIFHQAFSTRSLPVKLVRNAGLALAHRAGPVKRQVLAYALGLSQPF